MQALTIGYPDGLENAVRLTHQEFAFEFRLMAAFKMFELGKLSSGKAAELAGLSRAEFIEACGRYRVPVFNYDADELEAELKSDMQESKISV